MGAGESKVGNIFTCGGMLPPIVAAPPAYAAYHICIPTIPHYFIPCTVVYHIFKFYIYIFVACDTIPHHSHVTVHHLFT